MALPPAPALSSALKNKIGVISKKIPNLRSLPTLEDFVYQYDENSPEFKFLDGIISALRIDLQRHLIENDVYIGVSVIEGELYDLVSRGSTDPIADFLQLIETHELHEPGFVLYPLHAYGVIGAGLFSALSSTSPPYLQIPTNGLAVTSQLNDLEKVKAFLRTSSQALGIQSSFTDDDFDAHCRHPVLKWVKNNPLMMVRVRSFTAGQYENQSAYVLKLSVSTSLVMMAAAIANARPNPPERITSTSMMNNFETLDIRHYLVFENGGAGRNLHIRRVPMNVGVQTLAQLSDLAVEVDLAAWNDPSIKSELDELSTRVSELDEYYRTHHWSSAKPDARGRLADKLMQGLFWFRRSFNSVHDPREAIVSLAVAYECLLSDGYSVGITDKIRGRAALCIGSGSHAETENVAVRDLFDARGAIVHKGSTSTEPDMTGARRSFVRCFVRVVQGLGTLPPTVAQPIAYVLGDGAMDPPRFIVRLRRAYEAFKSNRAE